MCVQFVSKVVLVKVNKIMLKQIALSMLLFSSAMLFNSDLNKSTIYAICGENEHVFHARCVVKFYGFFGYRQDQEIVRMGTNCTHDPKKIVIGYQKPLAETYYCAICKKELHFRD